MRNLLGYLVFAAVIGGILLVGLIFRSLGLLRWYDLIWEVVLRASSLSLFAFVAYVSTAGSWKSDKPRDRLFRFIVILAALLGAAAVMAFWDQFSYR